MPRVDVLAGPNGAGKTSLFVRAIEPERPGLPFVNPDKIAQDVWGAEAELHAVEASQIATRVRDALIDARIAFATESTFSHPSKQELIERCREAGFDVTLHVILIQLATTQARVQGRVAAGGHSVPPEKVSARYERMWGLIAGAVPMCTATVIWDNDGDQMHLVARLLGTELVQPATWPEWTPAPIRALDP